MVLKSLIVSIGIIFFLLLEFFFQKKKSNLKIKVLDPKTNKLKTVIGPYDEPSMLSLIRALKNNKVDIYFDKDTSIYVALSS